MSRWFRIYDDVLDDPKVQKLSGELFKTWVNLLCLASKDGGILPSIDDIAFRLRISAQDAQQRLDDLILAGLVDIRPDEKREPHNWAQRQMPSDSSTERSRKHREKRRNVTATLQQRECNGLEEIREEVEVEPEQIRQDTEPNPRATREVGSDLVKSLLGGVGSQAVRRISIDAKRKVCTRLQIVDCEAVVHAFLDWDGSHKAQDLDAMFISSAERFFKGLPDHVRRKLAIAEPEPDKLPPIRASTSLQRMIESGEI